MKFDNNNQLVINNIKLNYHENGQGDVLVFIHGNRLASGTFVDLYNYFSDRYKVVAIDNRGYGSSECGEVPYSIELFADDIITFCSKKNSLIYVL